MQCKSLWIKASAKCINVNVNVNGRDFFPSVTCTEGESETARLERLFMIYWFYKKMSWWIFNIIGWLFSHTAATQLCSNLIKVIFA